jgi:hypothetical protein
MRRIIIVLFACSLVCGCKKKIDAGPSMPSPTQTGQNIIACKVNGKTIIYSGIPTYLNDVGVRFGKYKMDNGIALNVEGHETEGHDDNLTLLIYELDPTVNGQYTFSTEITNDYAQYYTGEGFANDTYKTKNGSGYMKFTRYDSTVVAGTFEFTAYNPNGAKVEITEGFFDIKR